MTVGSGDVVRVSVEGQYNNVIEVVNVFHLRKVGGGEIDEADVIDDMVEILETLYQLLQNILSVLWVVQRVRVTNQSDDTDVGSGLFVDSTPGAVSTAIGVPQVAAGLTLTTSRLRHRGRKFFGPIPEALADPSGILTAASILTLADVGDLMTTQQSAVNGVWEFGIIANDTGLFLPFQSYSISTTAVTQRRRRLGVGS